jgi:hypothetical protein
MIDFFDNGHLKRIFQYKYYEYHNKNKPNGISAELVYCCFGAFARGLPCGNSLTQNFRFAFVWA